MKQHITTEQMKEVVYNATAMFNLLQSLSITIEDAKVAMMLRSHGEEMLIAKMAKELTIGKMIEILINSDFCFPNIGLTESKNRSEYIVAGVTCLSGSEKYRGKTFEGDSLCDALWEAVKKVLAEGR